MTYAVRKDDFIVNIIVAHESQREELEAALGATFEDPTEYGLTIGDYWNGVNWTRNVDGEQVVLEPVGEEPTQIDRIEAQVTYTAMMTDTLLEEE